MKPLALSAACVVLGLAACTPTPPPEDWSGFGHLENVLQWTPEQQRRGYPHMDRIYPARTVPASPQPFPLPDAPVTAADVRYTVNAESHDIDDFITHNHVAGLLMIQDGQVALERYAQGHTRDDRWYSFSVVKSVVSMLVGAAIHDGFIPSVDVSVSDYLPSLRGSAYDAVTLRQAMAMSSGVEWDETYADPESDIAQTGGSALDRLAYLLKKPRVAPAGERFNYNTEETNLIGAVLRSAIGNNLSTYLHDRIWRRFGMEHGGCCLSASLRDYGRIGLFALRGGMLPDGSSVMPDGWMDISTQPSPSNERYGLLWWRRPPEAYAALGIFGQAIFINPPRRLVVVTQSAWPRPTDAEFAAHRDALFAAMAEWAARQIPGQPE